MPLRYRENLRMAGQALTGGEPDGLTARSSHCVGVDTSRRHGTIEAADRRSSAPPGAVGQRDGACSWSELGGRSPWSRSAPAACGRLADASRATCTAAPDASVLAAHDRDGRRRARDLPAMLRELGRPLARRRRRDAAASADRGRAASISPTDVLRDMLDADLLPHLAAARHLMPLLAEARRDGSYVLIGGPGSETPWAGYGLRSVAAAALRMLAQRAARRSALARRARADAVDRRAGAQRDTVRARMPRMAERASRSAGARCS